ncbi:MAG TPA: DNA polymerase IV, partial [Thermoguttaceae bacterium]|nr:DNA polymerase IV [Thermoguttaceae bacterium]
MHVDMDAYFASVEERDRPELVGRPVIVGGSAEQRGVVAAANYVARQFGVHSAMPAATAKRLCPQGVFLSGRMDRYAEVSRQIHEIFHRYTPLVEPLSLDEAFLDVTGSEQLFGPAVVVARRIKREIQDELKLVASAGVAPNKFLAKIASDLDKPNGFVVVAPEQVQQFLDPLPVGRIWGVGKQSNKTMQSLGVRTIGDLSRLSRELLESRFGSNGDHFWRLARGIDERMVVPDREAKSISHETTFATDIADQEVLRAWLSQLTDQVARRLRQHEFRGSIVQVKVRFADFRTITRSQKLPEPTNVTDELWQVASKILASRLPANPPPVRLLGMGVSGIDQSQV